MPKYISTVRVAASPDAVWPLVSDLTRHGEWAADPLTVTQTGDGTYTSVATSKGKEFRADLTVLAAEPGRSFSFQAKDATGTYEHRFTLASEGAETVVTREVEATDLSLGQTALFYAALPVVKKPNAQKALDNLAVLAVG